MPLWIHRTTKQVLTSTSPADLTEPEVNYIQDPDLSAVVGEPAKYWLITGDLVSLVDQATQDSIDADLLVAFRDAMSDQIDEAESYTRAFALIVMDELNVLRAQHGLSARTPTQLKTALRNRLDT